MAKVLSSLAIGFGKLGKGGKLGDGVNPRRTKPDTSKKHSHSLRTTNLRKSLRSCWCHYITVMSLMLSLLLRQVLKTQCSTCERIWTSTPTDLASLVPFCWCLHADAALLQGGKPRRRCRGRRTRLAKWPRGEDLLLRGLVVANMCFFNSLCISWLEVKQCPTYFNNVKASASAE